MQCAGYPAYLAHCPQPLVGGSVWASDSAGHLGCQQGQAPCGSCSQTRCGQKSADSGWLLWVLARADSGRPHGSTEAGVPAILKAPEGMLQCSLSSAAPVQRFVVSSVGPFPHHVEWATLRGQRTTVTAFFRYLHSGGSELLSGVQEELGCLDSWMMVEAENFS